MQWFGLKRLRINDLEEQLGGTQEVVEMHCGLENIYTILQTPKPNKSISHHVFHQQY